MVFGIIALLMTLYIIRSKEGFAEPSSADRSKLISDMQKAGEKARASINNFKDAQKKMEDLISTNRDQAGLTKSQLFLDQIKSVNEEINNVIQEGMLKLKNFKPS